MFKLNCWYDDMTGIKKPAFCQLCHLLPACFVTAYLIILNFSRAIILFAEKKWARGKFDVKEVPKAISNKAVNLANVISQKCAISQ